MACFYLHSYSKCKQWLFFCSFTEQTEKGVFSTPVVNLLSLSLIMEKRRSVFSLGHEPKPEITSFLQQHNSVLRSHGQFTRWKFIRAFTQSCYSVYSKGPRSRVLFFNVWYPSVFNQQPRLCDSGVHAPASSLCRCPTPLCAFILLRWRHSAVTPMNH